MSYLVLARKYRPRSFGQVTGQEVVTRTLRGAIEEGRVAHAYLLCGPRGTGKTTTARLFAKALNCEQGPTPDPCNACPRCTAADAGGEPDIIEIDAASHTGVENVRELRDQAAYAPMNARHKIYIIDEVHMLSRPAFNALLKTLEEPPPHVKFLFATTEPHKLPDTILSRCQVLKLSALSETAIEGRLDEVFAAEGVAAEAGVTAAIARRARGGMRDALSLADQLLALVGESPTLEDTGRLAAGTDREGVERIVRALLAADRGALLGELGAGSGGETELVDALLEYLRGALLAAHCGAQNPLTDAPAEARESMAQVASELGPERLELWLEDLLAVRDSMRLLPGQARLSLELCLLQLARPEATIPLSELYQRLAALEGRLAQEGGGGVTLQPAPRPVASPSRAPQAGRSEASASAGPGPGAPTSPSPAPAAPAPGAPRDRDPAPAARPAAPRQEAPPGAEAPAARKRQRPVFAGAVRSSKGEAWKRFLEELELAAPGLASVLEQHGKLVELAGGRAVVRFQKLRQADRPLVQDPRNQKLCCRVLSELLGEAVEVRLEDASEQRPGDQDDFTRKVADLFDGRIED